MLGLTRAIAGFFLFLIRPRDPNIGGKESVSQNINLLLNPVSGLSVATTRLYESSLGHSLTPHQYLKHS